jgi:anti-repressor protein
MEGMPVACMGVIGGVEQLTADARELHKKLESGNDFSTWFASRIKKLKFVENQHFILLLQSQEKKSGSGGSNKKDYALTLGMARELSMIENNEKGQQARRYFIECERIAHGGACRDVTPSGGVGADAIGDLLR